MKYTYSKLRFVPDPASGEFVNVGVIVGSDSDGKCILHLSESRRRAFHLAPRKIVNDFWSYLQKFKTDVERSTFSTMMLDEMRDEARNLLQFSDPAPMVAEGIEAAQEIIAEQVLGGYTKPRARRGPTKTTLLADVRRIYMEHGLEKDRNYTERTVVRGSNHSEMFDFVVMNGEAVQLTQAWNFRQSDRESLLEGIKAWAYTVLDIREEGGTARARRTTYKVPPDVAVEAVYVEPKTSGGRAALDEALHAFEDVDAQPVPRGSLEAVGDRAAQFLES